MNSPEYKSFKSKKIFFCVLNWGIGHATRSIPIIKTLIENQNEIYLYSDGEAAEVLKETFPEINIMNLPSYNIKYSRYLPLSFKIFFEYFKLTKVIKAEHKFIEIEAIEKQPDIIITDNRYGCYWKKISKNYIITHQLQLVSSVKYIRFLSKKMVLNYLKPFNEVWIPDTSELNLSGLMTDVELPMPKRYIGVQSAMKKLQEINTVYEVLVLLSGPEPNRTILENTIKKILINSDFKVVFVAGNYKEPLKSFEFENFTYFSKANRELVGQFIQQSKVIVSRSGYSTLMDLWTLNKDKIICIPTHGQKEQEYLAEYLEKQSKIIHISEKNINEKLISQITKLLNL